MNCWPVWLRQRVDFRDADLATIRVAPLAAWSCASTILDLCAFYFILCAFRPTGIGAALVTFVGMTVASGLPVSVSGLGVREAVATFLLARFSVPSAVAVEAAFLLYLMTTLLPAIVGGCFWLAYRRRPDLKFFHKLQALREGA